MGSCREKINSVTHLIFQKRFYKGGGKAAAIPARTEEGVKVTKNSCEKTSQEQG